MKTSVLYTEKQYFRQWWLWLLIATLIGYILYKIIIEKDFGTAKNALELTPLLLLIPFIVGLWLINMKTEITKEGIYISFYPLLLKTKFYSWDKIQNAQTKKYKFSEFGGWGIRLGAYNVSGNKGLEIVFKDETKLIIGTQQPEKIQSVINQIFTDVKTTD